MAGILELAIIPADAEGPPSILFKMFDDVLEDYWKAYYRINKPMRGDFRPSGRVTMYQVLNSWLHRDQRLLDFLRNNPSAKKILKNDNCSWDGKSAAYLDLIIPHDYRIDPKYLPQIPPLDIPNALQLLPVPPAPVHNALQLLPILPPNIPPAIPVIPPPYVPAPAQFPMIPVPDIPAAAVSQIPQLKKRRGRPSVWSPFGEFIGPSAKRNIWYQKAAKEGLYDLLKFRGNALKNDSKEQEIKIDTTLKLSVAIKAFKSF